MTATYLIDPARVEQSVLPKDLEVAEDAALVIGHMLGDCMSVIDPSRRIWTAETAESLRSAIEDHLDEGGDSTWVKFEGEIANQPPDVILLAAEIVFLRDLPNTGIKTWTKLDDVNRVLSWLPEPLDIPVAMREALSRNDGAFKGGMGYSQFLWKQVPWFARLVKRWQALNEGDRQTALSDPWAFRRIVMDDPDDLAHIRNSFLYLTFPRVFEPIVSDKQKRQIRDAFADAIGGPTGQDTESVDRDLLATRAKLQVGQSEPIVWWFEPWGSLWRKQDVTKADQRAWLVRTGPEGQRLIDRWLRQGFVSLAAVHLGVLETGVTKEAIAGRVQEGYEHVEYPQRRALTEDYSSFITQMSVGDVVLARHDDMAWIGRITRDFEFTDEAPRLRRAVEWVTSPVAVELLPAQASALPGSPRLITDLTEVREALESLAEDEPMPDEVPVTLPRANQDLADDLNVTVSWLDEYIKLLESRRQVIVYGPPGTGKTYIARRIAQHVAGENLTVVQFHPSYAYEDFFEGLRPVTVDGSISYELVPGPLRRLAASAADDPSRPYVLIVDEINRADIAKVFGELYYLLEYRGDRIALQYSPEQAFSLPKNLYLIGTMNTADRSIALVDAAIRRRFPFIELHPSEEPVKSVLSTYLKSEGFSLHRADLLAELNRRLGDGKLRDFQIGPSYLMRTEAETDEGLSRVWRYDILPLLEEQLYATHTREQVHEEFGLEAISKSLNADPADDSEAQDNNDTNE